MDSENKNRDVPLHSRFNFEASSHAEATRYIENRAKQLLRYFYRLLNLQGYDWGVSALFEKEGKNFQFLYLFKPYRKHAISKEHIQYPVLVYKESSILEYLKRHHIEPHWVSLIPFQEYQIITDFYGNKKTQRSGLELMNHIDEGLYVLEKIKASDRAKKAYCLHPLIQSDEALLENYNLLQGLEVQVIIALTEYRSVANEYLSNRVINNIDEIRISPLKDVNDMLIADKIQNRKDFQLYHLGKHPRSNELDRYFKNWLKKLNISEDFYQECAQYCRQEISLKSDL